MAGWHAFIRNVVWRDLHSGGREGKFWELPDFREDTNGLRRVEEGAGRDWEHKAKEWEGREGDCGRVETRPRRRAAMVGREWGAEPRCLEELDLRRKHGVQKPQRSKGDAGLPRKSHYCQDSHGLRTIGKGEGTQMGF